MKSEREISIAKARNFDVGYEDHGLPFMYGEFEYEDGGMQGFGSIINIDFVTNFCKAFGVMRLQDCNGKIIKVEHDNSYIYKLIPLKFSRGKIFDVEKWASRTKEVQ